MRHSPSTDRRCSTLRSRFTPSTPSPLCTCLFEATLGLSDATKSGGPNLSLTLLTDQVHPSIHVHGPLPGFDQL